MLNIKFDGAEELEALFKLNSEAHLKDLKFEIYNDVDYISVLEFGSLPGEVWNDAGNKTKLQIDVFTGEERIVSVKGFAMVRKNLEPAKKMLKALLQKIDLSKPFEQQVKECLNIAGAYYVENIQFDTPVSTGKAKAGWKYTEV